MFTETVLENPLLLACALVGILVYWCLLGRRWDQRMFLALNLSLITLWAGLSTSVPALRLAALLYILLLLLGYWTRPLSKAAIARTDGWLDFDAAPLVLTLSALQCYINISSGYTTLDDKAALLMELAESATSRYTAYILFLTSWLSVHTICRAASQRRWSWMQVAAIAMTAVSFITGLSKGSFMPLLLTFLFVYRHRIPFAVLMPILASGFALAIFLVQRLFPDAAFNEVAGLIFERIIRNVDVLDYIDSLDSQIFSYPHISPAYLAWPLFQLSQRDFLVPGVWLHGTLYADWRGFGPNPTFVVDQLVAAFYIGLPLAFLFGKVLRLANRSRYRVLIAVFVYTLLQDWYLSCLQLGMFLVAVLLCKALVRRRSIGTATVLRARRKQRPA
jgi:hypothetical protein